MAGRRASARLRQTLGGKAGEAILAAPAVSGGQVFFGTFDGKVIAAGPGRREADRRHPRVRPARARGRDGSAGMAPVPVVLVGRVLGERPGRLRLRGLVGRRGGLLVRGVERPARVEAGRARLGLGPAGARRRKRPRRGRSASPVRRRWGLSRLRRRARRPGARAGPVTFDFPAGGPVGERRARRSALARWPEEAEGGLDRLATRHPRGAQQLRAGPVDRDLAPGAIEAQADAVRRRERPRAQAARVPGVASVGRRAVRHTRLEPSDGPIEGEPLPVLGRLASAGRERGHARGRGSDAVAFAVGVDPGGDLLGRQGRTAAGRSLHDPNDRTPP